MEKRNNFTTIGLTFLVIILVIGGTFTVNVSFSDSVSLTVLNYTPHDPIYIDGDADFTAENGVVGGDGTEDNPFRIEGWEIIPTEPRGRGIAIYNTTVHFVIRYCYIHGGMTDSSAISMGDVQNGRIWDTIVINNADNGLHVWGDSREVHLFNCTFNENGGRGVNFNEVSNVSILYCVMNANGETGLFFGTGQSVSIHHCTVNGNGNRGINFNDGYDVWLVDCETNENKGGGLFIGDGSDIVLIDCVSMRNGHRGITMGNVSNLDVIRCQSCFNNHSGFYGFGDQFGIFDSIFTDNMGYGIAISRAQSVGVLNCTVTGNNWSGFAGKLTHGGINFCTFADNGNTGISLSSSNLTEVAGNTIRNNTYGIYLFDCENSRIARNNFFDNTVQAVSLLNFRDNVYFSVNYWSDYQMWHPFASEEDDVWNRPHFFFFGMDRSPVVYPNSWTT